MTCPRRTAMLLAGLALLAAIVVGMLTRAGPGPWDLLARATQGRRPVGPQFVGTPGYGPATTRGGEAMDEILPQLLAAAAHGDREGHSALAAFYLLRAGEGDAQRALGAAASLPEDPAGHNDRGAVLLGLGRPEEALEQLAASLATVAPSPPAALFNRALALSQLELWLTAAGAWEEVLAEEPEGSGFATEAREQRQLAAARAHPSPSEPLDVRKRQTLEALLAVTTPAGALEHAPAAEELRDKGDALLVAEIAYLAALPPAAWRERAATVRRYLAAREEVFAGKDASAELRLLGLSEEPIVSVKALHVGAYAAILRADPAGAERWLEALRERCNGLGCAEELAVVVSDLGTLLHRAGDYQGARRAYSEAMTILPAGYEIRRSELLRKRAHLALDIGDFDGAEPLGREAARIQREAGTLAELAETLRGTLGNAAGRRGRHSTDLAYRREALAAAELAADLEAAARARCGLARAMAETGDVSEALELMRAVADQLQPTALRLAYAEACSLRAEFALRLGLLDEAQQAGEAALEIRRRGSGDRSLSDALRVRAQVARARAEPTEALRFAREAVAVDRERASLAPGPLAARRVAAEGGPALTLLVELVAELEGAGPAIEELVGGLPPLQIGECRIAYIADETGILTLALDAQGSHVARRALQRTDLARGLDAVDRTDGRESAPLDRLQALLGSPWDTGRCGADTTRVAILETPATLAAPLALLARRERPRALVATALHPLAPWPAARIPVRALAVLDPAQDPAEALLPYLPGAGREVEALRAKVPGTRVLRDLEATPANVSTLVPGMDLLHLAVHAEARRAQRAASFLRLAGAGGRLQVADILGLPLGVSHPLVVLPACRSTGASGDLEHDGSGLPWAFLAAGASGVVASFQTVDDAAAEAFTREFYKALCAGEPAAEAVAQGGAAVGLTHGPEAAASFVLTF